MSVETPKLTMKKVCVFITMKPIVFVDEYATVPTNAEILKNLANLVGQAILDEKFQITITPEE